jgi:DtxR family transcriptional regulator, Mn-dependent transcriptional regulator
MSLRDDITHAVEDYLKTIFELTAREGRATTSRISERLGVTPASVTGMVQKLAATKPPLIEYRKRQGAVLTPDGEQVALEIMRHHRLLEMFLHETLGYGWDEVHAEADRLEHVISEDFEERIAQALGDPSHDPHGDPIPTRELELPATDHLLLSSLRVGQRAAIRRVLQEDAPLLRYLSDLGIKPSVEVAVEDYSPFDENLYLRIGDNAQAIVLGPRITRQIFVDLL